MNDFQDETLSGEQWPVEKLIPYEKNAKKHPKEQIEKLAESIRQFGWRTRILVGENGEIIAGHGRTEAAKLLKLKTVPVTVVKDLTESKRKALRMIDNHIVSNDYYTSLLAEELSTLITEDDMDLSWAFSDKEISFAIDDQGEVSLDALTDSLMDDLDDYQENTNNDIKEKDDTDVPLAKVFSFSKVSGTQARNFTLFEKYAEGVTGLDGAEAVSKLFSDIVSAA